MKENLHVAWNEIKKNKLCVTSFLVAIFSQFPFLFNGQFVTTRWIVYFISMTIYLCTLFKPNFICKHFKRCP